MERVNNVARVVSAGVNLGARQAPPPPLHKRSLYQKGCNEYNPSFILKDKPSFHCAFMVKNKLVKCTKFDTTFCPKSCNMREECKAAMEAKAGMLDKSLHCYYLY
jgi:hypothetical protein